MQNAEPDLYAILGLDRDCSPAQIRDAYRLLVKQHHPDANGHPSNAIRHIQAINHAHEILTDPTRRREYDRASRNGGAAVRSARSHQNISHDAHFRLEDFLRGASIDVTIRDPANPNGPEVYPLAIPPGTAPGTVFRLQRNALFQGGVVRIRARVFPHFRFKVRGSDLRCDLKINARVAAQGGEQLIKGVLGSILRVKIPARVARGEIIRITAEGLPKPRGGRGDLLVRVVYQPEVRIKRRSQ